MSNQHFSYLALGDSYTIGESVLLSQSFPYQTVQLLRNQGFNFYAPEIIAKTGWTTDELLTGIENSTLLATYDFVSLLIGVNNQYRERDIDNYKNEFETLLLKAISFSKNKSEGVIVLSIPDWGVTPFAAGRDQKKISAEIDLFNRINKGVSESHQVSYINITDFTREAFTDVSLLAEDKLHPSGKDYGRWAGILVNEICKKIAKLPL
jgi:lysophospholipase L1-like esterase